MLALTRTKDPHEFRCILRSIDDYFQDNPGAVDGAALGGDSDFLVSFAKV